MNRPLSNKVHIIGAGLAGLAAAVRLAGAGRAVTLYEAAPRAGGRCRSYHDPQLDRVIDNGNHLMLSGNHAIMAYLAQIGAESRLAGPADAAFPFVDAATGERWSLRPGAGSIPWWLFDPARRVPRTSVWNYLSVARVMRAADTETMAACVSSSGALYRSFWEPLTVAVLNTAPETAAAGLMRPVLRETFLKGADACRPLIARENLADTLVDPALRYLQKHGADVRFGARIRGLALDAGRVAALLGDGDAIEVAHSDAVILATPAWVAEALLPGLATPPPGEPIVNVHYRLPAPVDSLRIVGVVGGLAQWVFARGDIASVTISAAAAVADDDADDIARRCWPDVRLALNIADQPLPAARVVKERRATFAQTPEALRLRPACRTPLANLLLAGDWTNTGLPATIEGAVRSGFTAADAIGASAQTTRAA